MIQVFYLGRRPKHHLTASMNKTGNNSNNTVHIVNIIFPLIIVNVGNHIYLLSGYFQEFKFNMRA